MKTKPEVNERRQKAYELRLRGYSQEEIAQVLGVSRRSVSSYLDIEPTDHLTEAKRREYIDLQIQRIDRMLEVAMAKAADEGNLRAIDRVIRLEERRAKLLGLDAPVRQDIGVAGPKVITIIDDIGREE